MGIKRAAVPPRPRTSRFVADSPLEQSGFEPPVPRAVEERCRNDKLRSRAMVRWCDGWCGAPFLVRSVHGGTGSSNPLCSSRQSVSRPHPLSSVENPGFPRGCAPLAWRRGRQRRAGCFDIAPTGGNISVGPYSSTAVPLMGSARMPRCTQRSWAFTGLILVVR